MKNVLVITGSPRADGNGEAIADALIGGIGKRHNAMRFSAGRKNVRGCGACGRCWTNGEACVADDDFGEAAKMLESADMLVLISPLYWFGVSAQLKAVIDKFHAYSSEKCIRPLRFREAALIIYGETDLEEDFSGAVSTYKNMIAYKEWKDLGIMTFTCVGNKEDAVKTGAADKAEEFGKSL